MHHYKGIWPDTSFDTSFLKDIQQLGYKGIFIPTLRSSDQIQLYNQYLSLGFQEFIVSVRHKSSFDWQKSIQEIPASYYYYDEPYIFNIPKKELLDRRDFIQTNRPNSKFVIGDVREILKSDYTPIPGIHYTYSAYIGTFILFGHPLPFGRPNQVNTIKRLSRIVGKENIAFLWVFGKDKLGCVPDEYRQLNSLAHQYDIPSFLYTLQGSEKYITHITHQKQWYYIKSFFNESNPYNIFTWVFRNIISLWRTIIFYIKKL